MLSFIECLSSYEAMSYSFYDNPLCLACISSRMQVTWTLSMRNVRFNINGGLKKAYVANSTIRVGVPEMLWKLHDEIPQ